MISLLIFIFILGLLIIVHEFGHFIMAKRQKVRVENFSLGFGKRLVRIKRGETEYSISAIPLGGYVKLAGDSIDEYTGEPDQYFSKTPLKRFWIIFFGPLLNYILGFLFFWLVFFTGYPTLTSKVGGLIDGFGAKDAGLQVGDKIIAVDSRKVEFWEDLQGIIQEKRESALVRLSVIRDSKELDINVYIKEKEFSDQSGQKRSVGLLGITPHDEVVILRHNLPEAFLLSLKKTWALTELTYNSLWRVVTGRLSMRESVTGPLGIFYITSKAASVGLSAVLHLIAVLSISLGIFNLLPLPILDGGHILFLIVEKIRGKALGIKAERVITHIGLSLMIALAVFVTYNDVVRFFGDKIARILGG